MTEMVTIASEELERLKARASKCSMDKSYLQLVIRLMNRVSAASGLDGTVDSMMRNILDVIGGSNIILYYWIDSDTFYADVYGRKQRLDTIDDDLVRQVVATREAVEYEHPFSDTMMQTPEFTKAYTWVYPLLVGPDLVGVFRMESLHIAARDLYHYLPTFFNFAALILKNEVLGHTRFKQAYDHLRATNEALEQEVEERAQAEEELRAARDDLEERVAERTAALQTANEQLQQELGERTRAEEALSVTAKELDDLYNRAPCGYHSLDRDGTFVRINDTELEWLGYGRDEILGKIRFPDLVTERSRQIFRENFPRFMEQGWIRNLEFEMVRRDGTVLPVLLNATAVKDDQGNFIKSRSTVYDITEQKKAEEQEHLLSSIVQASDDAIIAKDPDGVILSWNRGAERIYGYAAEEVVGRGVSMLVPPENRDDLPGILATIRRGERIEHFVTKRLRKDGERIFVSLSVSPIKDAVGNIVGASAIARDITTQMKVEESLRQSEAMYRSVVTAMAEGVMFQSADGGITAVNPAAERIQGRTAEQMIGKSLDDPQWKAIYEDGRPFPGALHPAMVTLRTGESQSNVVMGVHRPDGTLVWISVNSHPLMADGGATPTAVVITFHDISVRKRAEEEIWKLNAELEGRVDARTRDLEVTQNEILQSQKALMNIVEDLNLKTEELEEANTKLQELDRLKSMFIASMSHELRTPLNSIIGFSSIIHDEWLGPVNREQKENLATIQRSGKHLLNLINDVIDVSKIEAGKIEIHLEEFDLFDLMTEAVQLVEKDIREKGLELRLDLQHRTICTDRRRLLQCIINLLSNAFKFTEQGVISVQASMGSDSPTGPSRRGGMEVGIAVHDTGVGIAAEDIPRLFQPFVRLDSPIKTIAPGTGLGLYLTKKLVSEVLAGDIQCSSSIGEGSTFTICIPERINEKGIGGRGQ